ncbi:Mg2 transporter protein [Plasmodium cynomolgi strain B]|uniref:Mg2 transporter protein n=1 Tax=Plasmodium cynomolgi (strain B) TaxID=1120755 RepID=K6UY12_PLACD|nr:Mg2 transporter protein [Plasmodium cynomolgi strain B]GAB68709.1 Mg2 transporter protein [Plasmodium cynomolgi strain B]
MSYESFALKDNGTCLKRNYDCEELAFNDDDEIVDITSFEKNTYEYNLKDKIINRYKKEKDELETFSRRDNSINNSTFINRESKLKRHVIIEIFGGKCFIREYICTEFLKRVKQCCHINYVKQKSGLINYRDCKQLLAENNNIASIEARLNAILVSLPPLTCIILHSSVFLVIKEDLIRDDLIKKLCNVSKRYTNLYKANTKIMEKRPFEFSALECVFSSAIEHLNAELKLLSKDFADIKFTLTIIRMY